MGIVKQSLTQLQAKAYAQECCSEWAFIETIKTRRTNPAGKSNIP
jgi:hypothetical protein